MRTMRRPTRDQHNGVTRPNLADPMDNQNLIERPARLGLRCNPFEMFFCHARIVFEPHARYVIVIVKIAHAADKARRRTYLRAPGTERLLKIS